MRYLSAEKEKIWRSGDYVGDNKPSRRVTVQKPMMRLETFSLQSTFRRVVIDPENIPSFIQYPSGIDPTKGESVTQTYANYLFSAPEAPMELPNVKSISWTRSTDQDVAECTIEFYNTSPLPVGTVPPQNGDLDRPGYYTAGRGRASFSGRWGHVPNHWSKMLMPDNILRTYEGYGTDTLIGGSIGGDGYVSPEDDSKVDISGVWLIDEVKLSSSGLLVCTCRDLGRLLMDHMAFLPVIPEDFYPISFQDWSDKVLVEDQRTVIKDSNNVEVLPAKVIGSGNDLWPESAYSGAKVFGHTHTDAMDSKRGSYWLSVGNARTTYRSSYEYIDIELDKATVTQIRLATVKKGYNIFVSIKKKGGDWLPGRKMGYHRDGRGRYEEGVPYVVTKLGTDDEDVVINLKAIKEVVLIRIWLGNLKDLGVGSSSFKYRAGIREVKIYGPVHRHSEKVVVDESKVKLTPGPSGANPGRVRDYTDIIKLLCAWAGLYWPKDGYFLHADGFTQHFKPRKADERCLGDGVTGRVWGDFQQTGVAPVELIEASNFDKKSLMDAVAYIRDIIGFTFMIDETGAVVWRMSNVWTVGNWMGGMAPHPGRTGKVLAIDERQVLMSLEASINSRNIREGIFVGNVTGKFAALVPGYNPNDTGLRRIAGWTDQNFASLEEAQMMADLIAVRQLFAYRTDVVQIPAYPGIQIDDQVRIFERVTSEGFIHYVQGISSTNDAETGQWTYSLQTHWLGDKPEGQWVFDKTQLCAVTQDYIDELINGKPYFSRGGRGGM